MGQHQRLVLLVPIAFFWASLLLLGLVAASASSDFEHRGQGDSLHQPGLHSNVLQFGSGSDRGRHRMDPKPDLTNIKRVLENKRERREKEDIDSGKVFRLKQSVDRDSLRAANVSKSGAGILGTLSEEGLEYVKDVLVGEILEEVTPLQISDINSRISTPIGRIDTLISDIYLEGAAVYYSDIELTTYGVTIYAAGITATLEANWEYHYTASYVPWPVGDGGRAEVKVHGMQAGVTFNLQEDNGTLRLVVDEAGTYIEDLEITLQGGASWLYQWFIYAFDYNIRAAVEVALTQQMVKGAEQLDEWLLNLPRAVPIDDTSAIDVTVTHDPLLSPTYLSVGAKGQFVSLDKKNEYPEPYVELQPGLFCDDSVKMVTIALSDYVLNSAAYVYYDSGELTWDVDNIPGKKYLNTASWRYIIPKLYKKYPNEDMILSFAVSSAPTVNITIDGIRANAGADMTIEVKDGGDIVPVACINLMVSFDAVAALNYANITGQATLDDLTLALKWSEIGSFPVYLVQATVRTLVQELVLPLINISLKSGFPIPMVAGVEIIDADLRYEDGYLFVCTDIHYSGGYFGSQTKQKSIPERHSQQ
ncbi:unnamed protein product [Calypogeia fissa]